MNFYLKDKKITKIYSDFENNIKSLFYSYQSVENSLAMNIISKDFKKISISEILNQEYKNTYDKEKILIKSKEEISEFKNEYFNKFDEYINLAKEISLDNINILKNNINFFMSLFTNYYKSSALEMEKILKNIATNEIQTDYKKSLDNLVYFFGREININKYKIKIIDNKYIEDKTKKLNIQKLDKNRYIIKDNKIYLKEEDIYEIVKIMYAQFQFINEKYYNLIEEQIKINVKNLTNKLLSFGAKTIKIFDLNRPDSINEDEINLLFKYLNQPINRISFLRSLNLFRANGIHRVPEREFEIIKNIFLKIADHIKNDKDYACTNLLLILSQTFYYEKDREKIYLDKFLKNNKMFLNLEIFEKYLIEQIKKDIKGLTKTNSQENLKENDEDINLHIKSIMFRFTNDTVRR